MDKIQLANDHKDAGNVAFKNNDFISAIRSYHHALLCVKGILSKATMKELGMLTGNDSSVTMNRGNFKELELTEQARSLKVNLHNNLAGWYYTHFI